MGIVAVTVKVALPAKWFLVATLRFLAYERFDVDVLKVSLERRACSEGNFGATAGPMAVGMARPLLYQCIKVPSFMVFFLSLGYLLRAASP